MPEQSQKRKLSRLPKVQEITGKSRTSIYAEMAAGKFPKNVPIGDRQVAWIEDEVYEYNEQRIREARGAA
jgi:prophage regulatory protein